MPTDHDLKALAAAAERDAAAGVKPSFLEWEEQKEWEENLDVFQPFSEPWRDIICISRSYPHDEPMKYQVTWWGSPGDGECEHHSPDLSSLAAAQLFAESLLRAATLPLHPQAPEVAAAVGFAREFLKLWDREGEEIAPRQLWSAMKAHGLWERDPSDQFAHRFTALGRALLASATPDSAPKQNAQPIDREEEKAP